ncbi:MAG: 5-(carboxyamino)imidazole ribonucleotide synthase [Acetobacter sp.]|nr:5-(carboxyamino)imidazole ribonucleotide synthase [Acetobacter sp.]
MTNTTIALPPSSIIGIMGGGQLGRMSAIAAAKLGFKVHIFTPSETDPAVEVAHTATIAPYHAFDALKAFIHSVDVITFEFENIPPNTLEHLNQCHPDCLIRPSIRIVHISQDRLKEKEFLTSIGLPLAPWCLVTEQESLHRVVEKIGLPLILKTSREGYDGKGQRYIRTLEELETAFSNLKPHPLIAESVIDFACELSVMVVRGVDGVIRCFDTVQNYHWHGVLDMTLAPAPIMENIAAEAQNIARQIAENLHLVGIMGIEMFLDHTGYLLVNEIAPRPHNSGHWTMDACPYDQFDMHIRAIAGLPLPLAIRHADAVMKNLVGPEDIALWQQILQTQGLIPHLYGKETAHTGRKMGHVNVLFPFGALPGSLGIRHALGALATKTAAPQQSMTWS